MRSSRTPRVSSHPSVSAKVSSWGLVMRRGEDMEDMREAVRHVDEELPVLQLKRMLCLW
jgi:hypothetical protein